MACGRVSSSLTYRTYPYGLWPSDCTSLDDLRLVTQVSKSLCVSVITEDVLFQVVVAPGRDGTGAQVTMDDKPVHELPNPR